MSLVFDQATHSYERDGVRLPSVTQVLKSVGIIDPEKYAPGSAARGTAVHLACQYLDEGDLDESTIPTPLAGYLEAYRKFLADTGWKWTGIEQQMAHPTLAYAGTLDRIAPDLILDIKSGQPEPSHKWQLAGYAMMFPSPLKLTRFALYLASDGRYSIKEFPRQEYPSDATVFLSALNIAKAKAANGIA